MSPLLAGALHAAFIAAGATAGFDPIGQRRESFFPVTVGTKWVYERDDGKDYLEEIVTAVRQDDRLILTIGRRERGGIVPVWGAAVSDTELLWTTNRGKELAVPMRLLRFPVKAGDKWVFTSRDGTDSTYTVGEAEAVAVPAGTFEAFRINCDWTADGKRRRISDWYAAGVGLVRSTDNGVTVRTLKSFTPSKD